MDNLDNLIPMVNSPVDLGKRNIKDILEGYHRDIQGLTIMDSFDIPFRTEDYQMPCRKKFFFAAENKTYMVTIAKGKIKVSVVADFVVIEVRECTHVFNNKSNVQPIKYYLLTLKNANNMIESNIKVAGISKSDAKKFQESVSNSCYEFFINMKDDVFKCFFSEMVVQKVTSKVTIYENAGIIADGTFLYGNALATPSGVVWANPEGYIEVESGMFIKLAEGNKCVPMLFCSDKSGKEVAHELVENLMESWNQNILLPLFTLGHMIMSIFFEKFAKKIGVPTMIIYGNTASGKSTLQYLGISFFGYPENFMISGGSTAKSNEYLSANYNGVAICVDDVKGTTLTASNFTSLAKELYSASPRTVMKAYRKAIEYIQTCSPVVYSTNESLPNLQEVLNRLNVVQIFGKSFVAERFKYHVSSGDKLKELSLILPELLKIPFDEVLKIYNEITTLIKERTTIKEGRIINNLAYAFTGTQLLLKIAGVGVEGLQEQFVEYAQKQEEEYSETKNVVDRVLVLIPTLSDIGQIEEGQHSKIQVQNKREYQGETWVCFKKNVVLSIINKYFAHDRSKQIDDDQFTRYAKNHPRYRGEKTVDYFGKKAYSICFDVTGLSEYSDSTEKEPPKKDTDPNNPF